MTRGLPATLAAALLATVSALPAAAVGPVTVYIQDIHGPDNDKTLEADAAALTGALCSALAKGKRVDVLCAPDMRQLMSFSAAGMMAGGTNDTASTVQSRVQGAAHVVMGALHRDAKGVILDVKVCPQADGVLDEAICNDAARIQREQQPTARALLERIPALAERLASLALPLAIAPGPPPAPLAPTPATPTKR